MWKKIMVHSGLLSVFLFFSFFISCFLASSPSYAISDIVYTIDSTNSSSGFVFCGGSSGRNCSDYSFMYIYSSTDFSSISSHDYITFRVQSGGSWKDVNISPIFIPILFTDLSNFTYIGLSANPLQFSLLSGSSIVFTFSSSNPTSSCPEPEEPEPCPVIPENPYDDKFDQVIQAIYVCAGVMLVLYFFYCIYRLIIRNSGVK